MGPVIYTLLKLVPLNLKDYLRTNPPEIVFKKYEKPLFSLNLGPIWCQKGSEYMPSRGHALYTHESIPDLSMNLVSWSHSIKLRNGKKTLLKNSIFNDFCSLEFNIENEKQRYVNISLWQVRNNYWKKEIPTRWCWPKLMMTHETCSTCNT